jgi:hypothetical protein
MSEFEHRTRATLDESVARLDGRVRSGLTQARHAALEELAAQRSGRAGWRAWLQLRTLAPAGAVAAAALVAVVLWSGRGPVGGGALVADGASPIEDLELLADNDALAVSADGDYEFYEWAAAQDDAGGGESRGS